MGHQLCAHFDQNSGPYSLGRLACRQALSSSSSREWKEPWPPLGGAPLPSPYQQTGAHTGEETVFCLNALKMTTWVELRGIVSKMTRVELRGIVSKMTTWVELRGIVHLLQFRRPSCSTAWPNGGPGTSEGRTMIWWVVAICSEFNLKIRNTCGMAR